ncbi:hypothetical protein C7271_16275 [filamentous cyanobacterium CCP5]|nr:hypothetical protein C7271_16275 [filamentous cyanobacterium CCP5]
MAIRLTDLIPPGAAAGAALFLRWQNYHVLAIPQRELINTPHRPRFFGVGGKRQNAQESFPDCALREGREEIGNVIQHILSAPSTLRLTADGNLETLQLAESLRPRLIWEKRRHSTHGSMAASQATYYLVAYDALLATAPTPQREIAALLYLTDAHLAHFQAGVGLTLQELLDLGAKIHCQPGLLIAPDAELVPHGTVHLLIDQCRQSRL